MEEGLLVRQLDRTDYVGEVGLDFSKAGSRNTAFECVSSNDS